MVNDSSADPWENPKDMLGYKAIGETYTRLIQSINEDEGRPESKVISIEARFGHGKTFFRKAWAQHLRSVEEVVVEIDAQQSDHSGDPVVTFLGALLGLVPDADPERRKQVLSAVKKIGSVGAKIAVNALVRNAADQIAEAYVDGDNATTDAEKALDQVMSDVGTEVSEYLGGLIAHQLRADEARTKELPEQLTALFNTLTVGRPNKRIVVLIDELDRCHPEYAIALLEAMKLVFDQKGFVFVLMVNADYLERIANRQHGSSEEGERYLDKFVDIRLELPRNDAILGRAAAQILLETFPDFKAFGDSRVFSRDFAAELTEKLAPASGLSMRQIKRVLMKVEIALRCHPHLHLDLPLLVFLAFRDMAGGSKISEDMLRRVRLTPLMGRKILDSNDGFGKNMDYSIFVRDNGSDFSGLPDERYNLPDDNPNYYDWSKVAFLAEVYLPQHESILNAVYSG
ncbi:KAP family P-loop NTPase fold protein [Yoonia maritima]|uniref:KAP family P-loop NTPase fold protein n=1 Tax=Yoonia maritima TaxID=1435347 RepID=UPI000D0EBE13|nr:P-loop NTPase fold protein [Yoonia maritima]